MRQTENRREVACGRYGDGVIRKWPIGFRGGFSFSFLLIWHCVIIRVDRWQWEVGDGLKKFYERGLVVTFREKIRAQPSRTRLGYSHHRTRSKDETGPPKRQKKPPSDLTKGGNSDCTAHDSIIPVFYGIVVGPSPHLVPLSGPAFRHNYPPVTPSPKPLAIVFKFCPEKTFRIPWWHSKWIIRCRHHMGMGRIISGRCGAAGEPAYGRCVG